MNVLELRKMLENYPDEMPVMVDGYEGGMDDVSESRTHVREVERDNPFNRSRSYYGDHEYFALMGEGHRQSSVPEKALVLHRKSG